MKAIIILILCSIVFTGHSQAKKYYTKNGEISTLNTKSSNSDVYICEIVGNYITKIYNKNNKLTKDYPRKKDGSETNDASQVVQDDDAIIFKIVEPILKKYSFEIYKHRTPRAEIKESINSLSIHLVHNSETGEVLEMRFYFSRTDDRYASQIPIEAYAEMEKEIKKYGKCRITEEGKTRIFCLNLVKIIFKPKE